MYKIPKENNENRSFSSNSQQDVAEFIIRILQYLQEYGKDAN